jgi:hypothetical protein
MCVVYASLSRKVDEVLIRASRWDENMVVASSVVGNAMIGIGGYINSTDETKWTRL